MAKALSFRRDDEGTSRRARAMAPQRFFVHCRSLDLGPSPSPRPRGGPMISSDRIHSGSRPWQLAFLTHYRRPVSTGPAFASASRAHSPDMPASAAAEPQLSERVHRQFSDRSRGRRGTCSGSVRTQLSRDSSRQLSSLHRIGAVFDSQIPEVNAPCTLSHLSCCQAADG
jgi:hypothetical protein